MESEQASAKLHGLLLCSVFAFLAAADDAFVVVAVCRRWRLWGCSPDLWQPVLQRTVDCMEQLFARKGPSLIELGTGGELASVKACSCLSVQNFLASVLIIIIKHYQKYRF